MIDVLKGITDIISWMFSNIIFINLIFAVLIVFFQRRDPQAVWTWLLVLMCIPVAGFILYIILGQDFHKRNMFKTKEISDMVSAVISNQQSTLKKHEFPKEYDKYSDMMLYNLESSSSVYSGDNTVFLYDDGMRKMEALCNELEKAQSFIHIQYYIIRDDEAFAMLEPILSKKATQGVKIRILYDDMGCRDTDKVFWKRLEAYGIKIGIFFPAYLKKFQLRLNYRNHRKMVIIDNKTGFVGGFNIGREYINLSKKMGYWQDFHICIKGSAVRELNNRFILDWTYATGESLTNIEKYKIVPKDAVLSGHTGIQIITSGPDSKYQNIRNNYLRLINKAEKRICIQSPYFVPDEAILGALKIAVLSGVQVDIIFPCKPDHMFVYWVTYSYIGELIDTGANCYTFNDGFVHGKYITTDSQACCVGTANMDIRSFKLNFEVNAVIYDSEVTSSIVESFDAVLKNCTLITKYDYEMRGTGIKFKEQLCRLLSPIL